MTAVTRALARFRSEGFHLGAFLRAAQEDGVLVETHVHACPGCQQASACSCELPDAGDIYCQRCYALCEEAAGVSDSEDDDSKQIECPYCGGLGSQEWFESHSHPNPFGEEE